MRVQNTFPNACMPLPSTCDCDLAHAARHASATPPAQPNAPLSEPLAIKRARNNARVTFHDYIIFTRTCSTGAHLVADLSLDATGKTFLFSCIIDRSQTDPSFIVPNNHHGTGKPLSLCWRRFGVSVAFGGVGALATHGGRTWRSATKASSALPAGGHPSGPSATSGPLKVRQ